MGIKLLFNYKNLNQKLKQIKLLQKELMKYKSLYLDLVGSIHNIIDTFPKE